MQEQIKNTLNKYKMITNNNICVALSGGADSVCLLHILKSLEDELNIKLSAFHLNHMLRGEEADRDEAFVRELCEKLSVPLTVEHADINSVARQRGQSIELAARNVRYELLKKHSNGQVAVAHTASDNLETVIYNLARGSGIKGLCGIPPVRDIYIRPLIECTRAEVLDYLDKNRIPFVTDSTNLTDDYTRNFIRHHIVPDVLRLNSSAEKTVLENCKNLREDSDFLNGMALKIYSIIAREESLDAAILAEQSPAVAKRVLALFFKEKTGINPDNLHTNRMYEALLCGKKVSLPMGYYAKRDKERYIITREGLPKKTHYDTEISYKTRNFHDNVYNLLLKNTIDCDKIVGKLTLRTRAEGDRIALAGRGCTKSLKKLMNEHKIDESKRDTLPVAADDEGVVWVYSVGVAERVKVDRNTKNTAVFNVTENQEVNYDR